MSSISPAFSSRSDCPIPYVPEITPDLIKDCVIPPIPDPFWEADLFPPIIPPIPLGCPSISFSGSIHSGSPLSVSTRFSQQDGIDNCFPILDFDIQIPFDCPKISVSNSPNSWSLVAFSPSYRLQVSSGKNNSISAPYCDYRFDLDITFPCTSISISPSASYRLSWEPSLSVSTKASIPSDATKCDVNVAALFDIVFPCTSISISPSLSVVLVDDEPLHFEVIRTKESRRLDTICGFEFDFLNYIRIPCHSISTSKSISRLMITDEPKLSFSGSTRTRTVGENTWCEIDLDLGIECPGLSGVYDVKNTMMGGIVIDNLFGLTETNYLSHSTEIAAVAATSYEGSGCTIGAVALCVTNTEPKEIRINASKTWCKYC